MKNLKIIIAIVIIIIIILTIFVISLLKNNDNNNQQEISEEIYISEENPIEEEVHNNDIQPFDYFVVKNCINTYLDRINKKSSDYLEKTENGEIQYNVDEKIFKEKLYSILDESYINENKITMDNILKQITTVEESIEITITEINSVYTKEELISCYKVKGILQKADYNKAKFGEAYFIVNLDKENGTYSLIPINEKRYSEKEKENTLTSIKANTYNKYTSVESSNSMIAVEYFEIVRNLMISSPKDIYSKMADEYKNKRFGTLQNFEEYVTANINELKLIKANKYLVNETDGKIQYVVQDQFNNLYIFDELNFMNFAIKFDTYTIEEKKFTDTYANSESSKKVQMNIDKFFQMLNRHDYRTSYRLLDETFKKNNMSSQEFVKTIQEKLFTYNKIQFVKFEEVGKDIYAYQIKVTDLTGNNKTTRDMDIIMQLKEGTDFVMSFSITN